MKNIPIMTIPTKRIALPFGFIWLVLAMMTVGLSLHAFNGSAQAQSTSSVAVDGTNVRLAAFRGGRFEVTAPGRWNEYDANGNLRYTFREVRRDRGSVYLREDALQVDLQIDVGRKSILASWPGQPRHTLYRIIRSEAAPRTGGPLIVAPPVAPPDYSGARS